jgi:hypothetical protein
MPLQSPMAARLCCWLALCGCWWSAGCGSIPLPYATDVTGPVHGIRVCDAMTGEDLSDARATIDAGMGMTDWVGSRPPQLLIFPPGAADGNSTPDAAGLSRREDHTFKVPKRIVLGLVCRSDAQYSPATATITVEAPGYPRATLQYCAGHAPQAGWSDSRSLAPAWGSAQSAPPDATTDKPAELARCKLEDGGVLRFDLRRLTPEVLEAIRAPGRNAAPPDGRNQARFASSEQPQVPPQVPPPLQGAPACATSN